MTFKLVKDSNLGQSGASLTIIETNNSVVVRKSIDLDNIKNLTNSYSKHKHLLTLDNIFNLPLIKSDFQFNYYEMEYIDGISLGHFYLKSNFSESEKINLQIFEKYYKILSDSKYSNKDLKIEIYSKILDKIKFLQSINSKIINIDFKNYYSTLIRYFSKKNYLIGLNHGDASFDNILISNQNEIFFIDPIISPFESPIFDIARLSLDSKFGWWNSYLNSTIYSNFAENNLNQKIEFLLSIFEIPLSDLVAFRLLSAFRIIPYTLNVNRLSKLIRCIHEDGNFLLNLEGIDT